MKNYFIQKALGKHKKGALHKELGINPKKKLPVYLLHEIRMIPIGHHFRFNGKSHKVTRLLKQRVSLALTLRQIRR